MRIIGLFSVIITGAFLIYGTFDFPAWGDPQSPASSHLSTHYINKSYDETHVVNLVTSVLADYRGFDTMLETSVVFVAGLAIIAILALLPGEKRRFEMHAVEKEEKDLIVKHTVRMLLPPIQLFALYVIAHGHYSPGGGFQGGVILTASLILVALSFNLKAILARVSERKGIILGNVGIFIYAGTGVVCLLMGANFLDYGALEFIFGSEIMAHYQAMLVVEIGVGFTVMSMLYLIYANLSSGGEMDEGL